MLESDVKSNPLHTPVLPVPMVPMQTKRAKSGFSHGKYSTGQKEKSRFSIYLVAVCTHFTVTA